jgi:hypothetical protein
VIRNLRIIKALPHPLICKGGRAMQAICLSNKRTAVHDGFHTPCADEASIELSLFGNILPLQQQLVVGSVEPVDDRRIDLPNPGIVEAVGLAEHLQVRAVVV